MFLPPSHSGKPIEDKARVHRQRQGDKKSPVPVRRGGQALGEIAISDHRSSQPTFEELARIAPNTIAVSCPYCMTMFEDGLKNEKAGQVRILDLAEIIAPRIEYPQAYC